MSEPNLHPAREHSRAMTFGGAPAVLGVAGAIAGAIALTWFRPEAFATLELGSWFYALAGAVFGAGTGWLTGLIGAMGWLGE